MNYFYSFDYHSNDGQVHKFSWGIIKIDIEKESLYDVMLGIAKKNFPKLYHEEMNIKMIAFNLV